VVAPKPKVEPKKKAGGLDWSKATIKKETSKQEQKEPPKRGTKRSSPDSDTDAASKSKQPDVASTSKSTKASPTPNKPSADSSAMVKKGVIMSDEEEESEEAARARRRRTIAKARGRAIVDSDEEEEEEEPIPRKRGVKAEMKAETVERKDVVEKSLRVMMDIDDDEVETVRRSTEATVLEDSENSDSEPEHVPLTKNEARNQVKVKETGIDKKPSKPRAKKSAVPLGSNGKPKKRVVKSRKTKNDRGFMVAEDYSSYESVSGSEDDGVKVDAEVATPSTKRKANAKATASKASAKDKKDEGKPAKPTPKPKPRAKEAKETKEKEAKKSNAGEGEAASSTATKRGVGSGSTKTTSGKSGQKDLTNFFGKRG